MAHDKGEPVRISGRTGIIAMPHPTSLHSGASGARLSSTAFAGLVFLLVPGAFAHSHGSTAIPTFANVSVHDPSVVRDGSHYFVFGSHLASARTSDWLHWTQLSSSPTSGSSLFPDPNAEFADELAWVGGEPAFWAPDVIRLGDGRYYFYYCVARLDQPRASLGLAVADSIAGPYTKVGTLLRSGMWGEISPDGTIYDATKHPNAVDPDVFFDQLGQLWMVYGSYSGGIFILQLDPSTGVPLPDQGYGKKLIGGHHARIEGAFMLYSPESRYYYLFLSFGGLDSNGGYNIRIARSRNPDGPFHDAAGNDLTNVSGTPGTLFDDAAIAPYGVKLLGNYEFRSVAGEPILSTRGHLSPGHNSAYYDPVTRKHFLIFHTRFVGRGEAHEVRVHPLYLNADAWLVAGPHRYAGESVQRLDKDHVYGTYKVINHGKAISAAVNTSATVTLAANGTVTGTLSGSWRLSNDNHITLALTGGTYRGLVATQWDDDQGAWVRVFSALSADGVALWGSRVVIGKQAPTTIQLPDRLALFGETMSLAMPKPSDRPKAGFSYSVLAGPAGLTIDRATGVLSWRPTLTQVDVPYAVSVLALDTSPEDPAPTRYSFALTAKSANLVRRVDLDFSAETNGLPDREGRLTGFTTRLPGTGTALPGWDPNLQLNPAAGVLELNTTQADFFGAAGLAANSAPGVGLAALGFTGVEDFAVTTTFQPLPALEFIDQVGLYIGTSNDAMTRAGTIVWAAPERYSTHTQAAADYDGRFFGFGFDGADGMVITLTREAGAWHYYVDGVEWNPLSPTTFLDNRADLVAGLFAITPLNANPKTVRVDAFSLVVATSESQLTAVEAWRIRYFAQLEVTGIAADSADPDKDGRTNLHEFEFGTDPLTPDGP